MSATASRHDSIARVLREEILRGGYEAGNRLPAERELAARFSANRSSVREALKKLEQLGLVSIRHGGGATVQELHTASLDIVPHLLFVDGRLNREVAGQILDVHEMLIAGAARLAIERGTDDQLLHARELVARLGDPGATGDDFAAILPELLELIAHASRNLVLQLARNALRELFLQRAPAGRPHRPVLPPAGTFGPIAREIVAAIDRRDAGAAEEAVRRLHRASRERVLAAVEARAALASSATERAASAPCVASVET
jgi:DNA-binding FadR family transcriptional regulator